MGQGISLKNESNNPWFKYFIAYTINCVCHSIRSMFRVLGIHNFEQDMEIYLSLDVLSWIFCRQHDCWNLKIQLQNIFQWIVNNRLWHRDDVETMMFNHSCLLSHISLLTLLASGLHSTVWIVVSNMFRKVRLDNMLCL